MNCLNCGKETHNPRFCCLSCSASYNNKLKSKRKNYGVCVVCGCPITKKGKKHCSRKCANKSQQLKFAAKAEANGYFYPPNHNKLVGTSTIRKYLISKHGNKCSICGQPGWWNGAPLVLIVDHINGHSNDWSLTNIRLVCHHCDSQLPTYKGRNKGNCTRKYFITQK